MNTFTLTQRRFSAIIFAVVAAIALFLSAYPASIFATGDYLEEKPKVDICHWAESGMYTFNQVDLESVGPMGNGVDIHPNDIVPPFDMYNNHHDFEQNWDHDSEKIWENHCYKAKITVDKIIVGTTTVEASDFQLKVDDEVVQDEEWKEFSAGTYMVTETPKDGISDNYTQTFSGDCNENGEIILAYGEHKTCAITNDYTPITGMITVEKVFAGAETDDTAGYFGFAINAGDTIQFEEDGSNDVVVDLSEAPYTIIEVEENGVGYETTYDNCSHVESGSICVITNTYEEDPEPVVTIVAEKIVCTDESELPNYGKGGPDMTETTATDWVTVHDTCSFQSGWEFEWGPQSAFDAGDTATGTAGDPWTTFGPTDGNGKTMTTLSEEELGGNPNLWFREILQDGYVPFTHESDPSNDTQESAEVYCHTDVLNFDNRDRIDGVQLGETYYCIAWNSPVLVEPQTYRIDGHKFGLGSDFIEFLSGWTITASNTATTEEMSTTTDSEGYYYFDVTEGVWDVSETMEVNWQQVSVEQNDVAVETDAGVEKCSFDVTSQSEGGYQCDFTNERVQDPVDVCTNLDGDQLSLPEGYEFVDEGICEPIPEVVLGCTDSSALNYNPEATEGNVDADKCEYKRSRSSSSGSKRLSLVAPTPLVVGVTKVTPNVCPILTEYMQMGASNNRWEVMKLQMFLNIFVSPNPITGNFGIITDTNVKTFQEKYHDDIITPWYDKGIVSHHEPTGFVYKTTLWKINSIVCPDYDEYPNFEGEDLTTNIDLNLPAVKD